MPQFIIHMFPNSGKDGSSNLQASQSFKSKKTSSKMSQQKSVALSRHGCRPLGLIECQEIVREPIIEPGSCVIMDTMSDSLKTQNEIIRNRNPVEITVMSNESWQNEEQQLDSRMLLLGRNLISILVLSNSNAESQVTQTLELHFNWGIDRYFLIGFPCRLLWEGVLRVHNPTLDVVFGKNLLTVTGNTTINVHDHVVDVYAKIESFEHVNDRRRLAFEFYGKIPQFDSRSNETSGGDSNNPDYAIYFTMSKRSRPVALYNGLVSYQNILKII